MLKLSFSHLRISFNQGQDFHSKSQCHVQSQDFIYLTLASPGSALCSTAVLKTRSYAWGFSCAQALSPGLQQLEKIISVTEAAQHSSKSTWWIVVVPWDPVSCKMYVISTTASSPSDLATAKSAAELRRVGKWSTNIHFRCRDGIVP